VVCLAETAPTSMRPCASITPRLKPDSGLLRTFRMFRPPFAIFVASREIPPVDPLCSRSAQSVDALGAGEYVCRRADGGGYGRSDQGKWRIGRSAKGHAAKAPSRTRHGGEPDRQAPRPAPRLPEKADRPIPVAGKAAVVGSVL